MNSNFNLKALRIAYNQYFDGIDVVTDVQLLSLHYKFMELILNEEVEVWEDIKLKDYLVWQPFSDTSPSKVYSYLVSSYEDVVNMFGLDKDTIILDKLKAADVLSHNVVIAEFKDTQTKYEYANSATGESVYTPIAQELYDEFFVYYVEQLEELSIV